MFGKNEIILLVLIGVIIFLIYMNSADNIFNVKKTPAIRFTTTPATKLTRDNTDNIASSKLPNNIKDILYELERKSPRDKDGNIEPSKKDLMILVNAIKQEIGDTKKFVYEIQIAPKDKNGKPQISEKNEQLYNLMILIFMISEGTLFIDEITPLFKNLKS